MVSAEILTSTPREFLAPRQVLVGDNASSQAGTALRAWAVPQGVIGVIVDSVVAQAGIGGPLLAGLEEAGYTPQLFTLPAGEPAVGAAQQALDFLRATESVGVVGIGGGSAMDVAKIAALAAVSDRPITDFLGVNPSAGQGLPLALVPTTSGTGAEVTRISMLSDESGRKVICSHPLLIPTIAVLDPLLLTGLPAPVTAATGMDAIAHAVEAFMSLNRSPLTAQASLNAIALMRQWLPRAVTDGADLDARRATLYGAYQAGLALNAGVVLGHSLAYTIANRQQLAHGVTCAIALPYCVMYNAGSNVTGAAELSLALTQGRSEHLEDAALELQQLAIDLGLPRSLVDVGIPVDMAREMARDCIEKYPRPANPRPFDLDALTGLIEGMAVGDVTGELSTTSGVTRQA